MAFREDAGQRESQPEEVKRGTGVVTPGRRAAAHSCICDDPPPSGINERRLDERCPRRGRGGRQTPAWRHVFSFWRGRQNGDGPLVQAVWLLRCA